MTADIDPATQAAFDNTQLVLDAIARAVVVTDSAGTIISWNAASSDLYGWSEDEALGRPVLEVVAPALPGDPAHGALAATGRGEVWRGDVSIVRRDGQIIRIATAVAPLVDADGTIVGAVGSSFDVTEQRLA